MVDSYGLVGGTHLAAGRSSEGSATQNLPDDWGAWVVSPGAGLQPLRPSVAFTSNAGSLTMAAACVDVVRSRVLEAAESLDDRIMKSAANLPFFPNGALVLGGTPQDQAAILTQARSPTAVA